MKRLNFVKKLAEGLRDEAKFEDIINEEICEVAFELLCDADNEGFPYLTDAKEFLEEKGLLQYLSDYQLDNLYHGYLDRQWDMQQDNWG